MATGPPVDDDPPAAKASDGITYGRSNRWIVLSVFWTSWFEVPAVPDDH